MKSAKIADLKNNLSRYLAHVRDGGEVMVLDRDTPVARIVPFVPTDRGGRRKGTARDDYWTPERIADLQRQGILGVGDPKGLADWSAAHHPVTLPPGSPSVVDLLIQMRRESTR